MTRAMPLLFAALAAGAAAPVAFAHQTPPAAPTAVGAPPAAGATVSGVTVTGEKANPLVDKTTQYVREHLQTTRNAQYPRFRDAVCVRVVGLPDAFDAFIARRVVEVARQVGAPVDPSATCQPNVNVIFTADPKAQVADILKRRDIVFGFRWSYDQLKQAATFKRPIQAWYLTRTRDTTGYSRLELYNPLYDPPAGRAGSRLGNDMSAELVHTLIVADANKAADAKAGAVADYVAVLALARWRGVERCSPADTILNLEADGCDTAPEAATTQDLALLTGLYSAEARESGDQQRATIASAVRKADKENH